MKPEVSRTVDLFPINSKIMLRFDGYNLQLKLSRDLYKYFGSSTAIFKYCQREKIEISEEAREKLNKMKTYFKEGKLIIENNDHDPSKI